MQKKLLIVTIMSVTFLFSGCASTTPGITINEEFKQVKELDLLHNAIVAGVQKENWELQASDDSANKQTMHLRKTIQKRRSYTGKRTINKWRKTYIYAAINFTPKKFEIKMIDENRKELENQLVSKSTNNHLRELRDTIYLSLANKVL